MCSKITTENGRYIVLCELPFVCLGINYKGFFLSLPVFTRGLDWKTLVCV